MNSQVGHVKPDYVHTIPYNPALDGVRAFAILGVLFAHFGVPPFKGGGQGVDVFFVLSGYLITLSILREDHFSIGRFYWRRLVRLGPASAFVCLFYLIVGWLSLEHSQVISDIGTTLTFVSNWTRAFGTGSPQYLGQTWSLSVEEQFYLLAPILLLLVRSWSGRASPVVLACAAAACLAYRTIIFHQGTPFERVYNGLDTHCDGLLCGVMLGIIEADGIFTRLRNWISSCGPLALIILLIMFIVTEWDVATSAVVDLAALCLIISVTAERGTLIAKALSLSPVVKLGQISYSLYLWHYPIFLFLFYHIRISYAGQIGIGILLSLIMATLSHRLVEQPALRLRDWPRPSSQGRFGLLSVSATIALLAIGSTIYLKDEVIDFVSPSPLRIEAYGPESSVAGEGFNVQPNGDSIIWAKTSTRLPNGATASWHGHDIKMNVSSRAFSLVAPPDLLRSTGMNSIIIHANGAAIASINISIKD